MINDAGITPSGGENKAPHRPERTSEIAAGRRPFVAPRLERAGDFAEVTTQFAGDFSA